jgi:PIN domain nuclease of toxin-antitoxin system
LTSSPEKIEAVYVLDTTALIWHLKKDKKLGAQASATFEAAKQGQTQLIISAIVLAELYVADQKWGLFEDFSQIYTELRAQPYFSFVAFSPEHVLVFKAHVAYDRPDRFSHQRAVSWRALHSS